MSAVLASRNRDKKPHEIGDVGVEVRVYVSNSLRDTVYEDGVIRNVLTQNVHHIPDFRAYGDSSGGDPGAISHIQFAFDTFDATKNVLFDGGAVPPLTGYMRFRNQTNLPRVANFDLYRLGDSACVGGIGDPTYNACRVDNDTAGNPVRVAMPRVIWTSPADESIQTGSVTLTVATVAPTVEFYSATQLLATVTPCGGSATYTCNMDGTAPSCWGTRSPQRRAYFWAEATAADGGENITRVLRLRRS